MKNILAILIFLVSAFTILTAKDLTGEAIYNAKCATCHTLDVKKDMTGKDRAEMMKNFKAPPMAKVSAKVRDSFKEDANKSIAFVADYIVNPDINKSLCMAMAVKKFGVMPAVGKGMTSKEIAVVSKWLVTNFDRKWSTMMETKCKEKGQNSVCCAGGDKKKCGDDKLPLHPGMKCGANEMPKHPGMKCATGKCGGGK
jgi:mono/diheme cytochrome c family protein